MPTTRYYTTDGDLVPGVTTVLGVADKPALKTWAYNVGKEDGQREANGKLAGMIRGAKRDAFPAFPKKDWTLKQIQAELDKFRARCFGDEVRARGLYAKSGKAADAGTHAHDMIECHLLNTKWQRPDDIDPEVEKAAKQGFTSYHRWAKGQRLNVLHTELHLVSDQHRFGGTPDAIGTLGGRKALALLDWKTSNGGPYPEQVAQLAAYIHLWEEHNPDQPIAEAHLCRFDKRKATFHHSSWRKEDLKPALTYFLALRIAHENQKPLKELC